MSNILIVDIHQALNLFDSLEYKKQRNILNSALRGVMAPIMTQAKASFSSSFRKRTGQGVRSIGSMLYRRSTGIAGGARVKGTFKGYYGRFLDQGTVQRYRKNGASTGKLKPSLWFQSVGASKSGQAGRELETAVIAALNKAINKGSI